MSNLLISLPIVISKIHPNFKDIIWNFNPKKSLQDINITFKVGF